jgi:hypothetical protein
MIGKWHLGWDWAKDGKKIDFTKDVKNGPDSCTPGEAVANDRDVTFLPAGVSMP